MEKTTTERDNLRYKKIPLTNGSGVIPALGFGTLIPDLNDTKNATRAALEAGFRQLDSSERYRNEKAVGEAMQEVFKGGRLSEKTCLLARSCGTTTTALNVSNPLSRRV
jgi:diketogulonate reductase-like aldo/keto reductase